VQNYILKGLGHQMDWTTVDILGPNKGCGRFLDFLEAPLIFH
jgi:hypothetical protein